MTSSSEFFHRPELAELFAKRILSEKGSSGTFIYALRRTGKSTFIREDLLPKIRKSGAEVIYVDLWTDTSADPGVLISNAIRDHFRKKEGVLTQIARNNGVEKLTLGGFVFNLDKVGVGSGVTISRAFEALSQDTKKMIVMIVDEAQHSQKTKAGIASMYALKAARDELNSSKNYGFRLIATGSNKEKLSILVQGRDQAFLNARLVDLPALGDDYFIWEANRFDCKFKPTMDNMRLAFEKMSNRPEMLRQAFDDLEFDSNISEKNIDQKFNDKVSDILFENKSSFFRIYNSLPPLQAALLKAMAVTGENFAPYIQKTYDLCKIFVLDRTTEDIKIDSSSVSYALDALQDKHLIWKSGRGVYSIDDIQTTHFLNDVNQLNSQDEDDEI